MDGNYVPWGGGGQNLSLGVQLGVVSTVRE